jgi:RNA polymerase sigma-70 factor (ECF subfamily)
LIPRRKYRTRYQLPSGSFLTVVMRSSRSAAATDVERSSKVDEEFSGWTADGDLGNFNRSDGTGARNQRSRGLTLSVARPRRERQLGMVSAQMPLSARSRSERVLELPRSRSTDAELLRAVADGDGQALSAVWTRYVADVRGMVRRCLGPDSATDDLVQEVFIAFHRNASRLKSPSALRSYLLGIALRTCTFELRTRKRRFRWLRFTSTGVLPDSPSAECPVDSRDSLRALHRILEQVRELPRMAFILRYGEDLSPQEVAIALGVSDARARRAITEGRARVLELARVEPALVPYVRPWLEDG